MMNKSRGRPRAGTSNAKQRILHAAQQLFTQHGYDRTTLRAIAAEAECDVALIGHHYGSKKDLFAHTMALTLRPTLVLADALQGDPVTAPERLAERVLYAWEDPANRAPLVALIRAGVQQPEVMHAFREYLETEIVDTLVEYFGGPDATKRAVATMTVVIGLIFSRYIIGLEPLSTWPPQQLMQALTPALRTTTRSSRQRRI